MSAMTTAGGAPPRIERLKVRNFRALRGVELTHMTPLTVLLGPNGSGKSTVFDVFAFLAECFESGLRRAWEKRGRARELKSRGGEGTVLIEIAYREQPRRPLITYHLEVDERKGRPFVVREWLRWKRGRYGAPFRFLDYADGGGRVISGERPDAQDERIEVPLSSPDTLAVNALGQLAENPRVVALRNFIMGWHVSYLSAEDARGQPEAGPEERLSKTGDNLANVIQYLSEEHPERLDVVFGTLRERVPKIQNVTADPMPDGRLLLQIRDAPFAEPVMARFASDGTLKMLAYLTLLHDPLPPPFIGIEEPENFLHPRLLYGLGRGVPESSRGNAGPRDHPFPVLPRRAASRGSAGAVARRIRLHALPPTGSEPQGQGVHGRRRPARRSLDGGPFRGGRPADQGRNACARDGGGN